MADYTREQIDALVEVKHPAAKPRPDFTFSDFERMTTPIMHSRESGPGVLPAYARGLTVEGPSQIAGLAGSALDVLIRNGLIIPAPPGSPPTQYAPISGQVADEARAGLQSVIPIGEPVSQAERTAQAGGVGTAYGIAGAPIVAAAGPMAVAGEIGLATLGGMAGEEFRAGAERSGAGGVGQAAGEFAGNILGAAAPAGIVSRGPKVVQSGKNLMRAIEASPEVVEVAKRLGVPVRALVRDAGEFKTFIARHASGDERYVKEAADALREAEKRFGPNEMPTTRQIVEVMNEDAGAALASLEEGLGRGSRGFSADVAGRRRAATEGLRGEVERLRPDGTPERAISAYTEIQDRRWDAVNKIWESVPAEEIPMIPTAGLKAGAEESVRRAGEFAQDIPEEALKVLEWGDEVPWEQYQSMRSRMLRSDRIARKSTGETAAQHMADNRYPLLRAFNDELAALTERAGEAGGKYREALDATAKYYDDFKPGSVVVKSFEGMSEGPKIVGKILNAPKPDEEAARAVRIFDQEPGGIESLRRMFYDKLIGPDELNPGLAKQATKSLRSNENAARIVMGDEAFDMTLDILERARIVSVGKTGKSAQAMSVGSGAMSSEAVSGVSSAFIDPMGAMSTFVKKRIQKALGENVITSRILREAALDPKVGRILLDMPTPRNVEAWIVNWKKLSARAALRAEAQREARGNKP